MILLLLSYTNNMQVSTWNILRLRIISRLTVNDYCGIMFIRRGQRSWVANIFQVLGDVILLVMCVYICTCTFADLYSWERATHENHENAPPPPPEQWRFLSTSIPQISCKWLLLLTSVVLCVDFGTGARNFFVLFLNPNLPSFSVLKKKKINQDLQTNIITSAD